MPSRPVRATSSAAPASRTSREVMRRASHQPNRPAAITTAPTSSTVRCWSSRSRSSVSLNSCAICTAPRPSPSETVATRYMPSPTSTSRCSTNWPAGRAAAIRLSSAPTGSGGWPRSTTAASGPSTCTTVPLGLISSSRGPPSASAVAKSAGVRALWRTSSSRSCTTPSNTVCWSTRTSRAAASYDRNPTRTVTAAATAANDTVNVVRSEDSRARATHRLRRAPPERTQSSLSTYPTPRTVWIREGAPGSSSLRRR